MDGAKEQFADCDQRGRSTEYDPKPVNASPDFRSQSGRLAQHAFLTRWDLTTFILSRPTTIGRRL